jgi:Ser/Thr protein kinase RdoA (MazF antagonist)
MDEILHQLQQVYNLGTVLERPCRVGGTANFNFRLKTSAGAFFIRQRNPRYSSQERLEFEHYLRRHLSERGFPIPRVIPTKQGQSWAQLPTGAYEVFAWVEGTAYEREALAEAGHTLGLFHKYLSDFTPRIASPRLDDPRLSLKTLQSLSGLFSSPEEKAYYQELLFHTMQLAESFSAELYWSLPKVTIHGDYHPANVLGRPEGAMWLFDFDWAGYQPRLRDLADGLLFFAFERQQPIKGEDIRSLTGPWKADQRRAHVFLERYEAEYQPLTCEEQGALLLFIKARWLWCRLDAASRKIPENQRCAYLMSGTLESLKTL